MKFAVLLAIGLIVANVASEEEMSDEEKMEMFNSLTEDCKKTHNPSEKEIQAMFKKTYPTSPEGKCFVKCVFQQFNLMTTSEPAEFSQENYVSMAQMKCKDETCKQIEEIGEECKDVKHADACEMAILIAKCLEAGAVKRNMTMTE